MPNRLKNWTYHDVIKFFGINGFKYDRMKGLHEAWIGRHNEKNWIVTVAKKEGSKSYVPETMQSMIRQSGFSKEEWMDFYN